MNEKTYLYMIQRLENKLREYMTDQEYMDFSIEIAKETFMREVDNMGDSDFKDFCIENFEQIKGE